MIYNKYLIREDDHFVEENFPMVIAELEMMASAMSRVSSLHRQEMLLAFVRDHHMKMEWMTNNPELSDLLTSKVIPTDCLEALFDSSVNNSTFQHELELFISLRLTPATVTY